MRNRAASAIITFFGAIINSVLTIQVLATWRSIKWEPESEWELSGDKWQLTGVKIIWGLLSLYFASAASICALGFHGHKPSHVRFYRDYSIADFSFCAFFTALATYAAFLSPARAGVCEAFSHHPELMRDMLEMGLNLENCEQWLERAVFAGLAFLFVVMVIRLHFLLAVSNYYSHLARHHHYHARSPSCSTNNTSVYGADVENGTGEIELVYAPVPRHTLPKELQEQATEAWIPSLSALASSTTRSRHHHRRHHHRHHHGHRRSVSRETTGKIKLDISPDEGLLPSYGDLDNKV
ncbi:hypothetical protein CPC08DRAFT_637541 [Agrocybe pediades]|nr:hypothetical protein CPC08DRAFT_637541 [Agrocybe pediades]